MKWLSLCCILLVGCVSTHEVKYEEVQADGSYISTWVKESVPPGGKKLSEGTTKVGVEENGSWDLAINGKAETDAVGTAEFYQALFDAAFKAGMAAAAAQAVPPVP